MKQLISQEIFHQKEKVLRKFQIESSFMKSSHFYEPFSFVNAKNLKKRTVFSTNRKVKIFCPILSIFQNCSK
jgi:hypothetical protein